MENINWEFLVQIGILISLVILIFRIGNVIFWLHHHFDQVHEKNTDILEELGHIESNTK
jgi:hypothetical protein